MEHELYYPCVVLQKADQTQITTPPSKAPSPVRRPSTPCASRSSRSVAVAPGMFGKILVANRGEIACRIIRTAQRLGVKCVAVFSEADARAAHVTMADEARCIGAASSAESYLRIDHVLTAAKATGAHAIHPGYGFLSENAEFADAVRNNGMSFIGPPASAIRAMGSKDAAKELMSSAGVPLLPGYHGADQSFERLQAEAHACGLSEGMPYLSGILFFSAGFFFFSRTSFLPYVGHPFSLHAGYVFDSLSLRRASRAPQGGAGRRRQGDADRGGGGGARRRNRRREARGPRRLW